MSFLGIDAGATAAKWTVRDSKGVINSGKSQAMDGHIYRPESAQRIDEVLSEIASQISAGEVTAICAGFTGLAQSPTDQEALKVLFTKHFPRASVTLMSDIELAYRAHLSPGEGILLYAGTGSVAMHITSRSEVVRMGGWGYLLGDEGAGYWIGREAIRHTVATLEEDAIDHLASAISAALGARDWAAIRSVVYGQERSVVAGLTPVVAREALNSDPIAISILDRAAAELQALISRMDKVTGQSGMKIIFTGGIAHQVPQIFTSLSSRLGDRIALGDIDIAEGASLLAQN